MEVKECYICNEEKSEVLLSNICACKDRYIHKNCFVKLLEKVEHNKCCSVCKTTYKNVTIQKKCIPNMKIIILFSSLNAIFLFSLILFLQKLFSVYIEIFSKTNNDCEYFNNFTFINTTSYYMLCQNFLIENKRFDGTTLTVYIVFVSVNTVSLIRIYNIYKRNLFTFKIKCVYTREEPDILLSRCESVPC